MAFVMFGVAAGVSCALLRYPFLPLLPIGAVLAAGAALIGIACGSHPGVIGAEIFGSIAAPQFAFIAVSLADHYVRSKTLIPQVQAAIGRQLRAELEVPHTLPLELAALAARLGHS
jgi:hypothetical protein